MADRLRLARDVAWFKYTHRQPIRDPQREAQVLDRISALAAARGMPPAPVRAFFTAQIAAACAEQEALIRAWRRGAPTPAAPPRDLRTAIRADIDAANLALLDALTQPARTASRAEARVTLRHLDFSAEAILLATKPL